MITTTSAAPSQIPNYVAACNSSALYGKRIGVPRNILLNYTLYGPDLPNAFEDSLNVLRTAGAIIVDNTNFTAFEQFVNANDDIIVDTLDFKATFENYLKQLSRNPGNISSVQDLLNFTQTDPREGYPAHGTGLYESIVAAPFNNTGPEYWAAYQNTQYWGGEGGILGALKRNNLDALVVPSVWAGNALGLVGSPAISVPMGAFSNNTQAQKQYANSDVVAPTPNYPIGLSFLGPRFSEELLIGLAYSFEQKTQFRSQVRPYLVPKTELRDVM